MRPAIVYYNQEREVNKMTKIEMINEMIENNYIDVFYVVGSFWEKLYKKNRISYDEILEKAINQLQYHTLKKEIERSYKNYLTHKAMCVTM